MTDVAILIADMVRAGVDADLIGRTAEMLASKRPMSNAERQAKYREKQRELQERNESNEAVTLVTEGEKEKEKRTKKEKETSPFPKENPPTGVKRKGSPPRGKRIDVEIPDGQLPESYRLWAVGEFGLTDAELIGHWKRFYDYWLGVSGQKGVKADWLATWRNGLRNQLKWDEKDGNFGNSRTGSSKKLSVADAVAQANRELGI